MRNESHFTSKKWIELGLGFFNAKWWTLWYYDKIYLMLLYWNNIYLEFVINLIRVDWRESMVRVIRPFAREERGRVRVMRLFAWGVRGGWESMMKAIWNLLEDHDLDNICQSRSIPNSAWLSNILKQVIFVLYSWTSFVNNFLTNN